MLAKRRGIADSAGTIPSENINPAVVQVMQEVGIDISREKPKLLTLELMKNFDRVITMGCGVDKACPAGFLPTENWDLDDPEGKPIEDVRLIRYQIKRKVEKLVAEIK